jgi:hypothetical protein
MKSGKQRKAEIKANRSNREATGLKLRGGQQWKELSSGNATCKLESLAPSKSHRVPEFVERGHYVDVLFRCTTCLKQEVWSATRQKWWYEVAKGSVESRAKLCNSCRRTERERKVVARSVHLDGVAAKLANQSVV